MLEALGIEYAYASLPKNFQLLTFVLWFLIEKYTRLSGLEKNVEGGADLMDLLSYKITI